VQAQIVKDMKKGGGMNLRQKCYIAIYFALAASVAILELCGIKLSTTELVLQLSVLLIGAFKLNQIFTRK